MTDPNGLATQISAAAAEASAAAIAEGTAQMHDNVIAAVREQVRNSLFGAAPVPEPEPPAPEPVAPPSPEPVAPAPSPIPLQVNISDIRIDGTNTAAPTSAPTPAPSVQKEERTMATATLSKPSTYIKSIIATVGSVLAVVVSAQSFVGQFLPPGVGAAIGSAIAVVTGLLTFAKKNEHWVEDIGL